VVDRNSRIPFVGRRADLEHLVDQLADAGEGRGGMVLVSGEAGIGKTRLLQALAAEASTAGVAVQWGRCWEGDGAPAFWPWIQVLRALAHGLADDALRDALGPYGADVARVLPELHGRLPDLPPAPQLSPEAARFRVWDAVSTFLLATARFSRGGLLLMLDDLQWADEPSLLLLRFLAPALVDAPVLLAGGYRDEESTADGPLAATLDALQRSGVATFSPLRGLAESEVAELVGAVGGGALMQSAGASVAELRRRTQGNPLFISQIMHHMVESERPGSAGVPVDGWWTAVTPRLPESVRAVIRRRLARLSPSGRAALTVAAVAGQEFDLELVNCAGTDKHDSDQLRLLQCLEEAERSRLVEPVEGSMGRFRFIHDLVRQTLYDDLSTAQRTSLHMHVGEALEALAAGEPHAPVAELAFHFGRALPAGDIDRAVTYALRAAAAATATSAIEEAVRWYAAAHRAARQRVMRWPNARASMSGISVSGQVGSCAPATWSTMPHRDALRSRRSTRPRWRTRADQPSSGRSTSSCPVGSRCWTG
jgi:predicted ATPase